MKFVLVLLLTLTQQSFTKFSYCHETSRGPYELQCVDLNSTGAGDVRLKPRGAEETNVTLELSNTARDRFLSALTAVNFLADGANYESKKKVADLGLKKIALDMPSGRREANFNFSTLKEVTDLATFCDALINQETLLIDIDAALKFDRLSIPKRLDPIEGELKANRIADPQRLIPILEKIEADSRLVNFARARAGKLKLQLTATSIK